MPYKSLSIGYLRDSTIPNAKLLSSIRLTDKEQGLLDMLLGTSLNPHSLIRILSLYFG